MGRSPSIVPELLSLSMATAAVFLLVRLCAFQSSNPPEGGPESAAAGDQVEASAEGQGQLEAPAECLVEDEEGQPVLLLLTLQVEPEPAQRHETAPTEAGGACVAPPADRGAP